MKLKITESQLKRIKSRLNEEAGNRYSKEVDLNFDSYGAKYKGKEINDISPTEIRLSYIIDIEARNWGIRDISLYGIMGPTEVEVEVEYFIDNDNTDTVTVPLKLNWDAIVKDEQNDIGLITVGDNVKIELVNDPQGNLMVKEIKVVVHTL